MYKFFWQIYTNRMLIIFIRAIILYLFLLIAMRLMGKRQLSELQPFEFAITLVAAELACIPMADNTIPIIYGMVPILTLVFLHNLFTIIEGKSRRARKLLNGKPVIIITEGVVDCKMLYKCGLNINDILESMRSQGYFNISDIRYAIFETNGQLSILPKFSQTPVVNQSLEVIGEEPQLPYNIIQEGRFMGENLTKLTPAMERNKIDEMLNKLGIIQKNIFLLTITGADIYLQTYDGRIVNTTRQEL